jgi:hypothetical protein
MKAAGLLVLTLLVMRLASWAIGWVLGRVLRREGKGVRLAANLGGLGAFAGFLVCDRLPGEIIDGPALVFGVAVFAVFSLVDLWWWPWRTRRPDAP